jgi:formylglycine-generating enzyme required for sulfatase activity
MKAGNFARTIAWVILVSFTVVTLGDGRVFARPAAAGRTEKDPGLRQAGPAAGEEPVPGVREKQAPEVPAGKPGRRRFFSWLLLGTGMAGIVLLLLAGRKKSAAGATVRATPSWKDVEWVPIPAGEFAMGDNFGDGNINERPVHRVYLDNYAMARHEVTFDQYDTFCLETGRAILSDRGWGRGLRPAIGVRYMDALAFCAWLSRRIGRNVHLPTEAQWEKAARGATQGRYPWGNTAPDCGLASFYGCRQGSTEPVGSFPGGASPYGVLDMAGNAWEWVADYHSLTYYQECADRGLVRNPPGPLQGTRNGADTFRVLRGGDYGSSAFFLRATVRIAHINGQGVTPGFRPCLD